MTSVNWEKLKKLFSEAVWLEPDERAEFIDKHCSGEPELRAQLERLLAADTNAEDFLERCPVELADDGSRNDRSARLKNERLGAYRLVEEIGRGGMGDVYLGERADGSYEQRVAVKLVDRGPLSDAVRFRFESERRVLARLNHPNITRLIDAGTTEEGRPYFVMEYVDGQPIREYCADRELGLEERLDLIEQLLEGVQYAHANLIVHRDLKPANILVTKEGVVKIVDFGIARILAEEDGEPAAEPTRAMPRLLTPEYASPEHVTGRPVTTASDVYSLGVVIYELLAGTRPYQLDTSEPWTIAQQVCEMEPEPPSRAAQQQEAPPVSVTELSGDLDNIVLKALAKEPERRYATVDRLVEDLRRYRNGLPVSARPQTYAYRARKFVRRHRWSVGAAAAVTLSVLGGLAVAVWQADIAAEQRDRARLEAAKSQRVITFLRDMLSEANPQIGGPDLTVAEVLDRAARRVETELSEQPQIEATVRETLARSYHSLGLYEKAEHHIRAALAHRLRSQGPNSEFYVDGLRVLGRILGDSGRYQEAESVLRQALQRSANLTDRTVAHADLKQELAVVLGAQDRRAEAQVLHREVLETYQASLPAGDPRLASAFNNLATHLGYEGRYQEAETMLREALGIVERHHGEEHPKVAHALANLATMVDAQQRHADAQSLYRRALTIARRTMGPQHPQTIWIEVSLANALLLSGHAVAAEEHANQALQYAHESLLPDRHPITAYAAIVSAQSLLSQGRAEDAERRAREALESRQASFGDDHWQTANAKSVLGEALAAQGRLEAAEPLLLEAYRELSEHRGTDNDITRVALERVVRLYLAKGDAVQAEKYAKQLQIGISGGR